MNTDIFSNNHSKCKDILSKGMYHRLFPNHLEITPQINEVYELALAFYESQILNDNELIENGAYFARVGKRFTKHFLICTGEPVRLPKHSSSRLKSFFKNNQFRTGYATHGLFPYRGKFHPQMIKALINVMGLKPGDTIIDPMMGSGTVPVEACLMGINSIGLDASPFCHFMTQTKLDALTLPLKPLKNALKNYKIVFDHFVETTGQPIQGSKIKDQSFKGQNITIRESSAIFKLSNSKQNVDSLGYGGVEVYNFLKLAYLDSAGYSERSKRKSPLEQFLAILERYVFVVEKIQRVLEGTRSDLAEAKVFTGDARSTSLEAQSVDGILFSPPYSFAINYLKNDSFHLNAMGENIAALEEKMVGLRGRTVRDKYEFYVEDMDKVLSECARVLKPSRLCTIIVGTNDNQLSKALNIPREEVKGLHRIIIDIASNHGFSLIRLLLRQITGIANTMRNEYIIILQRG
jgi:DNA modification methylase